MVRITSLTLLAMLCLLQPRRLLVLFLSGTHCWLSVQPSASFAELHEVLVSPLFQPIWVHVDGSTSIHCIRHSLFCIICKLTVCCASTPRPPVKMWNTSGQTLGYTTSDWYPAGPWAAYHIPWACISVPFHSTSLSTCTSSVCPWRFC